MFLSWFSCTPQNGENGVKLLMSCDWPYNSIMFKLCNSTGVTTVSGTFSEGITILWILKLILGAIRQAFWLTYTLVCNILIHFLQSIEMITYHYLNTQTLFSVAVMIAAKNSWFLWVGIDWCSYASIQDSFRDKKAQKIGSPKLAIHCFSFKLDWCLGCSEIPQWQGHW